MKTPLKRANLTQRLLLQADDLPVRTQADVVGKIGTVRAKGMERTAGCRRVGPKCRPNERNFPLLVIETGRSCRAARTAAVVEVGRALKAA